MYAGQCNARSGRGVAEYSHNYKRASLLQLLAEPVVDVVQLFDHHFVFHRVFVPAGGDAQVFKYSKAVRPMDGITTGSCTPCRHRAGVRCWQAVNWCWSLKVGA